MVYTKTPVDLKNDCLFRGKRLEDGEWVYGNLIFMSPTSHTMSYDKPTAVIMPPTTCIAHGDIWGDFWFVDVDTIGMCSGFHDEHGRLIFQGDIVKTHKFGTRTEKLEGCYGVDEDGYPKRIPGYTGSDTYDYTCKLDHIAVIEMTKRSGFCLSDTTMFVDAIGNEVIGNIYDNPELLEKKSENVTYNDN